MSFSPASPLVLFGIPGLAVLVAGLFLFGLACAERALGQGPRQTLRRTAFAALAISAWAGLGLFLAANGALGHFAARPPPLLVLLLITLVGGIALGCSPLGWRLARGLPLWALVGFQAFRLPLELVLHRAARDGTMPVEMSFSGYNFDIVSGITAAVVALGLAFSRSPARFALGVVTAWNVLGVMLLCNIVTIAIAATPMFHAFGPDHLNVWITVPPFVLLPTILVLAALLGHVVIFRKLRQLRREHGRVQATSTGASANALNA